MERLGFGSIKDDEGGFKKKDSEKDDVDLTIDNFGHLAVAADVNNNHRLFQ